MCGIAGLFAPASDKAVSVANLTAMRDRMMSRGPDDAGLQTVHDGRLGLSHRRLSIMDLSPAGHQPMSYRDGRFTIAYNGEIYNHPQLRAELEAKGDRFRSDSDTETILAMIARYGKAALPRLRGMFAFALWDAQARTLMLARDTHGIKPLYYRTAPSFAFASQVKALLADPATDRRASAAGAFGYAVWGSVPEPYTIVDAISALPAGHSLTVDAEGRCGEPEPFLTLADIVTRPASAADIGEAIRDSVKAHMLADVEVGCFLSAGVDSGAILGMMRDAGAQGVKAVTLRFAEFEGTEKDESPLAAQMAARYGANHVVDTVEAADFAASLPAIRMAMDQPSIDGVNTWFVARSAARAGLKVAMSGLGGDELLGGYSTFQTVPETHRIAGKVNDMPVLGGLARGLARMAAPGKAAHVLGHAGTFAGAYMARRAMHLPEKAGEILPRFAAAQGQSSYRATLRAEALLDRLGEASDVLRVSALESSHYMRNQLLRDSDWAGMAHSLEIRIPLVDVVLSGVVAPQLAGLESGAGKRILANAPATPLPNEVVERKKTGFGIPVNAWSTGRASAKLAEGWAGQVLDDYLESQNLSF